MKKSILMMLIAFVGIFSSCTNNIDDLTNNTIETNKTANASFTFDIQSTPEITTRSADVSDSKWPTTESKTNAESVVEAVYSTPKKSGLSFFTTNYTVNLTNDKATKAITAWNGTTTLSLTERNNITVTLTENTVGAFPKFKTAEGWLDISKLDLDSATPAFGDTIYGGNIEVTNITNNSGKINVSIKVKLSYDSYLLVAPDASWSILTNVKGFSELKWGSSAGTEFNTYTLTGTKKWWYYWGTGNEYVWGKGTLLTYGFNLYSDGTQNIKVENGKWYALFASLASAGEGDNAGGDSGDKSKEHTVGGEGGITPTANDIASGGAIR